MICLKKIILSDAEYSFLYNATFLPQHLKTFIKSNAIEIDENCADELRDVFGEQLQIIGFDENYNLTKEGKILESLIDKFYV